MIFSLAGAGVDAPAGVAPVVALDQNLVAGGQQPLCQLRMLDELSPDDLLHDADLDLLPVRTERYTAAHALALARTCLGKGELLLLCHALLRLKGSLVAAVAQSAVFDLSLIEVAEIVVTLRVKVGDALPGDLPVGAQKLPPYTTILFIIC